MGTRSRATSLLSALRFFRTETGKAAATVRKEVGFRDRYSVSVEDGEDVVACILCFALIDGIFHNDDSSQLALFYNLTPAVVKTKDPHTDANKFQALSI